MEKLRAALYLRVSTEEQALEGYSLDAQEEKLLNYCEWVADDITVYDIYRDAGYSGRTINRPEYRRMMEHIDDWDLILVLKMDRIHRNTRNFMKMMDDLVKKKKEFRSATEELDTTTAMGRFVVSMIQNIAQLESEQIGERTKFAMEEKAKTLNNTRAESRTMGFNPPFGYRLEEHLLTGIPEELEIVGRVYRDYLGNTSLNDLAEELNRDGLRTRKGGKWTKDNLSTILHNPIYAGYLRWDNIISRHYATAPVNVVDYNEVQRIAAVRSRNPKKRNAEIIEELDSPRLINVGDFEDF